MNEDLVRYMMFIAFVSRLHVPDNILLILKSAILFIVALRGVLSRWKVHCQCEPQRL